MNLARDMEGNVSLRGEERDGLDKVSVIFQLNFSPV